MRERSIHPRLTRGTWPDRISAWGIRAHLRAPREPGAGHAHAAAHDGEERHALAAHEHAEHEGLAYLVVPDDLVDRVRAIRSVTSRHPPLLEQAVLTDFITAGHFARHLRRMRQVYAERLSVLLDGARQHLAGLLEWSPVEAGLQTVGWLLGGLDGESAAAAAARRSVEVTPLSRYTRRSLAREGLQLGFAAVDTEEIARGVRELAVALERESTAARRRRHRRPMTTA